MTDVADGSGNIVQRYNYSSFGEILNIKTASGSDVTSSTPVNTSYTFTGRDWDEDVNLYCYRARWYDPGVGRFLQVDPDPGKVDTPSTIVNKYAYVGNIPTKFSDPTGKFAFMAVLAFTSMFAAGGFTSAVAAGALAAITATFLGSIVAGSIYGAVTGDAEGGIKFAENVFNFSAGFLMINVAAAKLFGGGVASIGASGPFQGYVQSKSILNIFGIKSGAGLTLGASSTGYGYNVAIHEFGHTLQFFGITAISPRYAINNYLSLGLTGLISQLGVSTLGIGELFERSADYLGGLFR